MKPIPYTILKKILDKQTEIYKRTFITNGPECPITIHKPSSKFYYLYAIKESPVNLYTKNIVDKKGKLLQYGDVDEEHFLNKELLLYSHIPLDLFNSNNGTTPYFVKNIFSEVAKKEGVEIDFSIDPQEVPTNKIHSKIIYSRISIIKPFEEINKGLDIKINQLEKTHNIIQTYVNEFVQKERERIIKISNKI